MKKSARTQLKQIIIEAVQQYFDQSGINEILQTLYQNNGAVTESTRKIKNLINNNPKPTSRIELLKQKHGHQDLMLQDVGLQSTKMTPNIRATVNQNIDPLQNGGSSVLDNIEQLPNFLTKGLSKIQGNGS